MKLAEIIGHQSAVDRFRSAARNDRPAAAYLLSGPSGIGKRTLADAFTMELRQRP